MTHLDPALQAEAQTFADEVAEVLDGTVTNGANGGTNGSSGAAIRSNQDVAVEVLEELGYSVASGGAEPVLHS